MRTVIVGTVMVAVVGLWAAVRAQQGQRLPGPGSGIVTVAGVVEIANSPSVLATQQGEWKFALSNAPDVKVTNVPTVTVAPPAFLVVGGKYDLTWGSGERESVVVAQVGPGGWLRVQTPTRQRWINVAYAKAIEFAS